MSGLQVLLYAGNNIMVSGHATRKMTSVTRELPKLPSFLIAIFPNAHALGQLVFVRFAADYRLAFRIYVH